YTRLKRIKRQVQTPGRYFLHQKFDEMASDGDGFTVGRFDGRSAVIFLRDDDARDLFRRDWNVGQADAAVAGRDRYRVAGRALRWNIDVVQTFKRHGLVQVHFHDDLFGQNGKARGIADRCRGNDPAALGYGKRFNDGIINGAD